MNEIIALHEKILALPEESQPEETIAISKDEISGGVERLPAELQAGLASLQQAINETLPEDFDYFAFLGSPDDPPDFSLEFERMPTADPETKPFREDQPIVEQLREVDWEQRRASGRKLAHTMDEFLYLTERLSRPLPSAKGLQRQFRDETKDFVKEKRVDASRVHVLFWNEEEGLREIDFADGAELRGKLPAMIAGGQEIITIVAAGKPLPVERIDALKAEAQKALRKRTADEMEAADDNEPAPAAAAPEPDQSADA